MAFAIDQAGGQAGDQADQRPDRKIDAAGEDGQRLAEADEREIGRLLVNVQEVGDSGEPVSRAARRYANSSE